MEVQHGEKYLLHSRSCTNATSQHNSFMGSLSRQNGPRRMLTWDMGSSLWDLESIRSARGGERANAELKEGFFCAIPVRGPKPQAPGRGPCTNLQLQTSSVSKSMDAEEQNLGKVRGDQRPEADPCLYSKSIWVKGGLGKSWETLEEQTNPIESGTEQQFGFHPGVRGLGWWAPGAHASLLHPVPLGRLREMQSDAPTGP